MVSKGDLVEFKPGLFGIEPPNNYGIFIRRYRNKNTKKHYVELYTLKGKQEATQDNVKTKSLGYNLQLKNNQLPQNNILKNRLKTWITQINAKKEKMQEAMMEAGELSERGLWKKIMDKNLYDGEKGFSIREIGSIWYDLPEKDLSQKRIQELAEKMSQSKPKGQGYFDFVGGKPSKWRPISEDDYKRIKEEVRDLGHLRNKMFEMVEVPVKDAEDEDETEIIKSPVDWDNLHLTDRDKELLDKMHFWMEYFVINDNWPENALADTHVYAIDGFSLRNYLSYLAEDWVDEGRTSYSDAFVKFLIKTGYWNDSEALLAISKRNVKLADNFSWEIEERIENIAKDFQEPSETPEVFEGRTDLKHLESYTIDPPTAKDFDDAISLEEKENEYILWIHIADVAHYVKKDTSLDLHARRKATSVYLPTKTLPMLPTHLSDDLCSLREQVPRLAMSVEIHYDKDGNKLLDKCKLHNSVIHVNENLSYDTVNESIENQEEPFYSLHKFAQLLDKHRRGLALETDEVRLEMGGQMALSIKTSSPSTKMIETFMVSANETVAEIIQKEKLPVVYRNHPLPDEEDVEQFNAQAKAIYLDYEIEYPNFNGDDEDEEEGQSLMDMLDDSDKGGGGGGGNISFSLGEGTEFANEMKSKLEEEKNKKKEEKEEEPDLGTPFIDGLAQLSPEEQEEILEPFRKVLDKIEKIEDDAERKLGYLVVLRTLSRALYGAGNMGHFGLGSTAYLHFTSPIRRYPDIIAHRVCKAMLADEEQSYDSEEIDDIAIHCTEQSEIAEDLEKTITGAGFSFLTRNPDYTENKEGIIVSIFGGGVFVLLPNGIEARVPLSKLTDEPTFVDDYETMAFVGSRSDYDLSEEITPENWRELLQDDEDDEPIDIIAKIGDKMTVDFVGFNHVEGKVEAEPVAIYERQEDGYIEKEIQLEEEEEE